MINIQRKIKLPLIVSVGSFILIIGIMLLTNPLFSIVYVVLLFAALFAFLSSITFLVLRLQSSEPLSKASLNRVFIINAAIVLLLMLRSAKALNLIDLALMAIFFFGLTFYINRR